MPVENSIILITNENNIGEILKPKLVLLRKVDNILTVSYSDFPNQIKDISPEVILIYCSHEKEECLKLIKEIKKNEVTKNTSILLIIDKYNQDFILSAYEEYITDFITIDADDAEILIRTIWCFKKNSQTKIIQKQNKIFEELDIRDKNTGFYTNQYCEKIFETEFNNLNMLGSDAILMLIAISEKSKETVDINQLAVAIKKSIRNSDTAIHSEFEKIYVLLPETKLKGAFSVWDKIKKNLGEQHKIFTAISNVENKSFKQLEESLLKALDGIETTGKDLIIANDEEENQSDNWLDKIGSAQKNFKLFKQAFNKKLDKVITPVFFQMQKLYEEKLFETQIEQYSNSTLSEFILKSSDKNSILKITYPGFSKINIDIIHLGLDTPEDRRIQLDLTELDEQGLIKILEDFIQEFRNSE